MWTVLPAVARRAYSRKEYKAMGEVRCIDCGFLAGRSHQSERLIAIDARIRKGGMDGLGVIKTRSAYETMPICFEMAADLMSEANENDRPNSILVAIEKKRRCDSFAQWRCGYTPEDHKAMIERMAVLESLHKHEQNEQAYREREWQHRREEREFRERQERRDEQRMREEREDREKAYGLAKKQLWIMGGVVTVILLLGQLASPFLGAWANYWFGGSQNQTAAPANLGPSKK
jgi:hypothetical protein